MFEDYLKEVHAQQYIGTDDDMPDDFDRWLSNLDIDELIEYGNKACEEWHQMFREATRSL